MPVFERILKAQGLDRDRLASRFAEPIDLNPSRVSHSSSGFKLAAFGRSDEKVGLLLTMT